MSAVMWKEVRNMESRVLIGILDSRWRLLGNVVFSDRRIMDVAFLISLTNKNFFMISPPPPHSCLFLVLWFVFFRRLIALTFAGNTCLMNVSVCICIGFSEFNKPAMCKISHSHFFSIMLFVLPFRTEHSTYLILGKVCHFCFPVRGFSTHVTRRRESPQSYKK